jgi:hypothetical protein
VEQHVQDGRAPWVQAMTDELLAYARSTPHRTFVLYPLSMLLLHLLAHRGRPQLDARFIPLLAWGYLEYRLCGGYRRAQGGGGRGMETLPEQLITSGPYAYVRNPMYLGHLIFLFGLALVTRSRLALALAAGNIWWFNTRVQADERRLLQHLGEPYRAYLARVPRWIPRWP